jgi:WD40 repeat protein
MELRATLCGHEGGYITCIDISTAFGTIVTGCSNGHVLLWDLRTLTFMRKLRFPFVEDAIKDPHVTSMHSVISVSLNHKNGNVVTLVGPHLSCFDINAKLLASLSPGGEYAFHNRPTHATATDCPEWMEHGIVAITGHVTGDILLWGIDMDKRRWKLRHVLTDNPHSEAITALRVEASNDRQDTLLIGDKSGKISVCKTLSLDQLTQMELTNVTEEIRAGVKESSVVMNKKSISTETHNWMGYMTGND